MKVVIASDFHLKFKNDTKEKKERLDKVLSFLKSLIGNTDILILNGDIFDLWISWKYLIVKGYFPVLKVLAEIKESGCRIIYVAGNHDFWLDDFIKEYIKAEIYKTSFSETIDGKSYFVTHGDGFLAGDWRYKLFKSIVRSKLMEKFIKSLPASLILSLGNKMSRSSRERIFPEWLIKKREEQFREYAKTMNYDFIVFSHLHKPEIRNWGNKLYMNTGDWTKHFSYIEILDGKPKLIVNGKTVITNSSL